MKTCPKCKKELPDDANFCEVCGAQVFETIFCTHCGYKTSTEFAFCARCGASLAEEPSAEEPAVDELVIEEPSAEEPAADELVIEEPAVEEAAKAPKAKKFPAKALLFGGIGAVVVAALVVAALWLFGGGKVENYALYIKNEEIYLADLEKGDSGWKVTSQLDNSNTDEEGSLANGFVPYNYTRISKDGKYIFYPDKMETWARFSLYYRKAGSSKSDAKRIDTDVEYYKVNDSATIVTYLKMNDEKRELYQYKIGKDTKDKLAKGVENCYISADGKTVIYLNDEGNLYLTNGKDKDKIASNITSIRYVTADFKTVYFMKEDTLYKQEIGGDKEKIDSGVTKIIRVYDSGEIYYQKGETTEVPLLDFVVDDMKDADAKIKRPNYPDYPNAPRRPYSWNYDTQAEYEAAYEAYLLEYEKYEKECDRLDEAYDAAYDAYYDKLDRDDLREDLEYQTIERSNYSLYFYDGNEKTVIADTITEEYDSQNTAFDAPAVIYRAYDESNFEKVKLSDIDSVYDVEDMVESALSTSAGYYVAVKGTVTAIESKTAAYFDINDAGTAVCYLDNISEADHGDLYRISIDNGVAGKPELYDSDVYTAAYFANDNDYVYFKNYKGGGELYINKKKIDSDVNSTSVEVHENLNQVFYLTKWDSEKDKGVLKVYQDGDVTEIDDNVYEYTVTVGGYVAYLYDYDREERKGDLYQWHDGQIEKVDKNVNSLIPCDLL